MKTNLPLVVLFLFISIAISAQDYIPMLQEGNQWNVLHENTCAPSPYNYKRTYISKLADVVEIYEKEYTTVLTSQDKDVTQWEISGYLREDTENQKVYYLRNNSSELPEEVLLYDFKVQIGDIILANYFSYPHLLACLVVESDYIIDIEGTTRKRIGIKTQFIDSEDDIPEFDLRRETYFWIEGIGNPKGPLYFPFIVWGEAHKELLAFIQNGQQIYNPFNYEDDFIWLDGGDVAIESIDNDPLIELTLSLDRLAIRNDHGGDYYIELYDITGNRLKAQKCNTQQSEVNLSSLPKGIYVARVYADGYATVKKVRYE